MSQYPNELEAGFVDRMGLFMSRMVTALTQSFTGVSPIADLATGKCVEVAELVGAVFRNAVVLPAVLLALGAWISRRKPA